MAALNRFLSLPECSSVHENILSDVHAQGSSLQASTHTGQRMKEQAVSPITSPDMIASVNGTAWQASLISNKSKMWLSYTILKSSGCLIGR